MKKIPFSEDELQVVGRYMAAGNPTGKAKLNTPITPKENILAFLRNETPCWMPDGDIITITPDILPDNVARGFVQEANPTDVKGGPDLFGVDWVYLPDVGGSMVRPGKPVLEDVNDWKDIIKFPDIEAMDWEGCAKRNVEYLGDGSDPVWTVQFSGMFERLISFMDFEQAAVALIDEDQVDAVCELFDALTDLYIKIIDKAVKYFHITGYLFHDDWGSQQAPFFSKSTFREVIAPRIRRLVDHCHENGVIFELHSCGHTESMCDAICELGIDMWRPQPMNDMVRLYNEFGDKIKFGVRAPLFTDDSPVEDQIAAAKKLVHQFSQPGKFVFTSFFQETDTFRKALYEESRKTYYEM